MRDVDGACVEPFWGAGPVAVARQFAQRIPCIIHIYIHQSHYMIPTTQLYTYIYTYVIKIFHVYIHILVKPYFYQIMDTEDMHIKIAILCLRYMVWFHFYT